MPKHVQQMIKPTPKAFAAICEKIFKINNKETSTLTPFVLRPEQIRVAQSILENKGITKTAVAKSRQIGLSTVIAAIIAVLVYLNQGQGLTFGITAENDQNANNLLQMVKGFLEQLELSITSSNFHQIVLGSDATTRTRIVAKTVAAQMARDAQNNVFAGYSLAFVWISELALYKNRTAFSSITAAASKGIVVVESTPNGNSGDGETFYNLFNSPKSVGWDKIFFSFETQNIHTSQPSAISDQEWFNAQAEYGFTSRKHAAWWINEKESKGLTDQEMFRQYPVLIEHCWEAKVDAFFDKISPTVVEPVNHINCGEHGVVDIFNEPVRNREYIAGVDCAMGAGRDSSAVVVFELGTGKLMATYKNSFIEAHEFPEVIEKIYNHFKLRKIVIESNNMGKMVHERCMRKYLPAKLHNTNTNSKAILQYVRKLIGDQVICGGLDLKEECKSIYFNPTKGPNGSFGGKKDLLMAISFVIDEVMTYKLFEIEERKENRLYYEDYLL